ncbi:MAG: hypothetical protein ACP5GX_12655 [Anaerolineae bacterium]
MERVLLTILAPGYRDTQAMRCPAGHHNAKEAQPEKVGPPKVQT